MDPLISNKISDVLENVLHGVIVTDTGVHIKYWNRTCEEIFGYRFSEIYNQPLTILFDDGSTQLQTELITTCSQSAPLYGRWHGVKKNGSSVWLDVRAKLIDSNKNKTTGYVITISDIEYLKATEDRLKHNRAIAEAILSTSSDAIVTADENGVILSANKSACKMFEFEEIELIGSNLKLLMPFPYNVDPENNVQNYSLNGEKKVFNEDSETFGVSKYGSVFPIEFTFSEICWGGSKIFAGIIRDLTARRNLERKLAEISNEERRRIGSNLHDGLGQMLTGIRMLSESLARKLNANALPCANDVLEIAEMIGEADEMLRTISRDMVQADVEKQGLVASVKDLCNKVTKMTGVNCELNAASAIELDDHTMAIQLYRIIQEALNNAIKHGKPMNVIIRLSQTDYHTSVIIDDDGIGFSEKSRFAHGAGIEIMKHRAGVLGGILEITQSEEEHTQVRCVIPNNLKHF